VIDCESTARPTRTRPAIGVTVYGCTRHEAALVSVLAPRYGVLPTITALDLSESTVDLAAGNRCVSVGHKARIGAPTLRALRRADVDYLSSRSIGTDHVDVAAAGRAGIAVEGVSYSPDSVADYTLMLMLMAVRHAKAVARRVEDHDFRLGERRGRELRDLTVGVVGTGRIGRAVVERLRGFKSAVLTHDLVPTDATEGVSLDELLARSDIVTLHTPLTPATHHLLDRDRIARMKPGAILVNTGRGGLVDTDALVASLDARHLAGAALDVVEGEEGVFYADRRTSGLAHPQLLRLQAMANVLISPHLAFDTDHAVADMVENSLRSCVDFAGSRRD
jgi:D-specific alpha-keto acid dehydrogenase